MRLAPFSFIIRATRILIIGAACLGSLSAHCASSLRDQALALYADPTRLPDGDALLGRMRINPKTWGPVLLALSDEKKLPERVYIDIARAFVYVGDTREQVQAASTLLAQVSFASLDRSEWLYLCQKVAQRGVDAMPCARRLLREQHFRIPLMGGGDGVGKDYALIFLLMQMPEQAWNREIGDRLWRGADSVSSQVSMLTAMFYATSLRADAILAKFSEDPSRPSEARLRANSLLEQMSAMERNADAATLLNMRAQLKIPTDSTEEDLRAARRMAMAQVSRQALLELERYTFLIRAEVLPRWKERLRKLD